MTWIIIYVDMEFVYLYIVITSYVLDRTPRWRTLSLTGDTLYKYIWNE